MNAYKKNITITDPKQVILSGGIGVKVATNKLIAEISPQNSL